jgi:hypothetical protein
MVTAIFNNLHHLEGSEILGKETAPTVYGAIKVMHQVLVGRVFSAATVIDSASACQILGFLFLWNEIASECPDSMTHFTIQFRVGEDAPICSEGRQNLGASLLALDFSTVFFH